MINILKLNPNWASNYIFKSIWTRRIAQYIQGQEPEPNIREYFYYIDHEGMVKEKGSFCFSSIAFKKYVHIISYF